MAVEPQIGYGFGRRVDLPYADAIERTKGALREQGFGVLTEIDVKRVMKEKRGIDFRAYTILGACNPPLAERALSTELDIGLLLPCNVVVYEVDGGSVVEVQDPEIMLGVAGNEQLQHVAAEAKERLQRVIASVTAP
jgi:uncharacterized protein (DUF302 family)